MYKVALKLISQAVARFGGPSVMGLALACLLPLLLLQCSRVSLADLRADYSALQDEYAALRDNLARCREAASLHDLVLVQREREVTEINNKYTDLREDFLRKLANVENDDDSPAPAASFTAWCYQPLPLPVRGLFAAANGAAGASMPRASGPAPYGDSPAQNPSP